MVKFLGTAIQCILACSLLYRDLETVGIRYSEFLSLILLFFSLFLFFILFIYLVLKTGSCMLPKLSVNLLLPALASSARIINTCYGFDCSDKTP